MLSNDEKGWSASSSHVVKSRHSADSAGTTYGRWWMVGGGLENGQKVLDQRRRLSVNGMAEIDTTQSKDRTEGELRRENVLVWEEEVQEQK